jgi:hypothetical protein
VGPRAVRGGRRGQPPAGPQGAGPLRALKSEGGEKSRWQGYYAAEACLRVTESFPLRNTPSGVASSPHCGLLTKS